MGTVIKCIDRRSPAEKAGISAGERLVSINGHRIRDVLDYDFYSYDAKLDIELERDGKTRTVSLKKPEGAELGMEFETYLMDAQRGCSNKCIFCFIDQLPRGMRKTLYFKDDDARLSFLLGNYITLTNLTDEDAERMIRMRVSPLNVSVHTTSPELRSFMLGNKRGGESLKYLYDFCKAGLTVKAQIVVCPGVNDGAEIEKTLRDLSALHPAVESIAVVPVGITRHREGLHPLKPVDEACARDIISIVDKIRKENIGKDMPALCCAADELYLRAKLALPGVDYYEGFCQLENGVGLMTSFDDELSFALEDCEPFEAPAPFSIACGAAAKEFIEACIEKVRAKCPKLSCNVIAVPNDFFGRTVDVTGLVTGGDLIKTLKEADKGARVLLPDVMLRHGETVFLDDVSLNELHAALGVPVEVHRVDGGEFLDAVMGGKNE